MQYAINGTIMQTVAIDLSPGETVYSQTNTMAWMNDAVTMDTHTCLLYTSPSPRDS